MTDSEPLTSAMPDDPAGVYEALFDSLPVPVVITRIADEKGVYLNPAYRAFIGPATDEYSCDLTVTERLHPADRDKGLRNIGAIVRGERPLDDARYRVLVNDGSYVDVDIFAVPTTVAGEPGLFSVFVDRREVEASHRVAQSIIECIPIGLHFWRLDGGDRLTLLDYNPAAARILGVDHEPLLGLTLEQAFPANKPELGVIYRTIARDGGEWVDEDIEYDDGGAIRAAFSVHAFRTEPDVMVAAFTDITSRKGSERELERTREELEYRVTQRTEALSAALDELAERNRDLARATAAKDAFLASMSHELRTPLNSIIGFSSVLMQGMAGPLTPEQARQLQMINTSGRRLLSLVGDVLDLTALASGHSPVELREFDPCELAVIVADTVRPMASEAGLELIADTRDCPGPMHTDRLKVEQVLLNLLSNAIKYTPHGSVTLRVAPLGEVMVRFEVEDTGIGIAARDLDHIFEEFRQLPMTGMAKPEGTGLGLAISRQLAVALGGTLDVRSTFGQGSTFILELPCDYAGDDAIAAPRDPGD